MTPKTETATERKPRAGDTLFRVIIAMVGLLIVMVGFSIAGSNRAHEASAEARREATKAQAGLSVHSARQNGSFESIQSQLSTLRTYHSTLRGEMKEQRQLLDELLKSSYGKPPAR